MIEAGGRPRRQRGWPWMLTVFSMLMLLAWAWGQWSPTGTRGDLILSFGFIPDQVLAGARAWPDGSPWRQLGGLLTSLFIHADWLHLAGNLAYLWVFGITVERAIGAWGLAFSFLVLGALANLILAWQMGGGQAPVIGASSGVSAIVGLYLGLFPVSRMGLWLPLGLYLQFARVPAILVIGSWFTLQLIYTVFGVQDGTVAWWAHLAGFLAGLLLALLLRPFPALVDRSVQQD